MDQEPFYCLFESVAEGSMGVVEAWTMAQEWIKEERAAAVAAESARRDAEMCEWTEAQDHGRVERQFDGCNGRWGYTDAHGFKCCPNCGKRIEIKEAQP